ncbi:MAG TPA: outer membrane beta-barrel protein [Nitrospiria bacterium]|nr:outer membrane beta-barrel protein [Nitrospiria bacterium]
MKNKNWMLLIRVFLLVGGLFAFPALTFGADAAPPPPPKWYDTISMNGFVDGYYSYNSNTSGASSVNGNSNIYHNFDMSANDLQVSLVELNIVKPVDDKNKAGFYLGFMFGEAADVIACGGTLTCTPMTESATKNIRQAYASILLTPSLQLDFGKYVTQMGAEVIESKDNWNYTRSLLYTLAIPYLHTGARLTYTFNDKVYLQGQFNNGWNNGVENNNGKYYGVQLGVTPVKSLPIVLNYATSSELSTASGITDDLSLLDVIVTYNATNSLSFMANYDNATQKQGLATGDAKWDGLAIYAKYAFTNPYAVVARYELFNDADGLRTGYKIGAGGQKLSEGTITLEYSGFGPGSLFRLDLRQDMSDGTPFTKEDGSKTDSQLTATIGVVQTF